MRGRERRGSGQLGLNAFHWAGEGGKWNLDAYFSVKVRFRSQTMMGRLRRSLYVGIMIEYLSLEDIVVKE